MAATLSFLKLPSLSSKHQEPKFKISIPSNRFLLQQCHQDSYNPQKLVLHDTIDQLRSTSHPLTGLTFPFFVDAKDALAACGEFGIFEGRSFALIHPIVIGDLFAYTLYADEINQLKKEVGPVPVTREGTPVQPPKPSPVEAKIQQLTEAAAAAAALVPAIQKGNETARNLRIALNALNVILFIWQIPTGIDIVFKVFEFTKWP
ncbi:unnamed protein product [Withania somnifera]